MKNTRYSKNIRNFEWYCFRVQW